MKKCCTCKIEKPFIEFCKNKSTKDGYSYQCKVCTNQYYIKIIDKRKQYLKDNADKIRQQTNQYKKQWRKDNVEHITQYTNQYYQTEHGKLFAKARTHKRRALLKNNTPVGKHWTPQDIKDKLKLQHDKCVYCATSIKEYYEIDHILPVSKGGNNQPSNIQLLCEKCNGPGGKWNKLPHEFAQQHGKLF